MSGGGVLLAAPDFLLGRPDLVSGVSFSLGFGGEPMVPVFGLNCRSRFGCSVVDVEGVCIVAAAVSWAGVLAAVLDTAGLASTRVSPLL